VKVFRRCDAILGESLVWDAPNRAMMWCDISAGLIHRSPLSGAEDGSDDSTFALPAPASSFGLAPDGGLVVSLADRVVLTSASGEISRELARIPHQSDLMRLNEGKVDPFGQWVTGSMHFEGQPLGAFYAVDAHGTVHELARDICTANGLEWSPSGDRIWFTDTGRTTIYEAQYSPAGVSAVRPWHEGDPNDGLVRASDGSFFSALYGMGTVAHYDPSGRELATIAVPAPNVTSVGFDGDGVLYVASARENLTERQLEEHPLSGSIFAIDEKDWQ
jgi:sugar lactone lactonase YvrE